MARGRFTIEEQIENCNKKITELEQKKAALLEKKKQEDEEQRSLKKKDTIENVVQMLKNSGVTLEEIATALEREKNTSFNICKDEMVEDTNS